MSNKPKIFGYCDAGCKWEVPHKDEVNVKSTSYDVTLLASAWSNGIYTWEHEDITATCPIELLPQSGITSDQLKALQKANIVGDTQIGTDADSGTVGSIQLVAKGTVPAVDIPVKFIVRGDL